MAITPTQDRYVDPFADIFSDKVDKRLGAIFPTGRGIISGLLITYEHSDMTKFTIKRGTLIKDYVTIFFPYDTQYDISTYSDGEYYIICSYTYSKVSPPPQAQFDLIDISVGTSEIILAKVAIQGGQLNEIYTSNITPDGSFDPNGVPSAISYDDREPFAITEIINEYFNIHGVDSDLDMNHYKVIQLGVDATSITDPLDGANKAYVDQQIINNTGGVFVKVDGSDSTPDYLDNKILVGANITKDVRNSDLSPATSGNPHVLYLTGLDEKVDISSGDASSGYLSDKIVEGDAVSLETVTDGTGNQTLKIHTVPDQKVDPGHLTTHGGLESIVIQTAQVGGNLHSVLTVSDIFIHKAGNINELVTGTKTFESVPKTNDTPTNPEDLVTKEYVDNSMSGSIVFWFD